MATTTSRIETLDLLRGAVMIIMALDHVRDYFYFGVFFNDPNKLETTFPLLFFTRFVTNFCAPVFVFLAGASAFLSGQRKTKNELSRFLWTRGIWLVFLELIVNNFIWTFDITFSWPSLQVIWAIGWSMVFLAFLIYLPYRILLGIGVILVAGHNLLDGILMEGKSFEAILWYILHQKQEVAFGDSLLLGIYYPLIPWIGVIILGYCFGSLYQKDFDPVLRKKWLMGLGLSSIALFLALRGINVYGDLVPWTVQKNTVFTFLSFLNVTKYPPSLQFILMTIGPSLIFLRIFETKKSKLGEFLIVFGRVPFLFYFLHVLLIHGLAVLILLIFGADWTIMILDLESLRTEALRDYGYPLWVTYGIWIGLILGSYPICKKYMFYKAANRDKWWLSYF